MKNQILLRFNPMVDKIGFSEIRKYLYSVLSFVDESGYPFSIPLTFHITERKISCQKPKSITHNFVKPRKASLVFHGVNEDFTNPRQILLKGQVVEKREGELIFQIKSFSRGNVIRRDAKDEFIRKAKKQAQKYLDEKGVTWYKIRAF